MLKKLRKAIPGCVFVRNKLGDPGFGFKLLIRCLASKLRSTGGLTPTKKRFAICGS